MTGARDDQPGPPREDDGSPGLLTLGDLLYAEIVRTVGRRSTHGRVTRADSGEILVSEAEAPEHACGVGTGSAPGSAGDSAAGRSRDPIAAPLRVRDMGDGQVRIGVGLLAEARVGMRGADLDDRCRATLVEVIEWLDAVLDGRVHETLVIRADRVVGSRLRLTWRDGSHTRIATAGITGHWHATHQRRHLSYTGYAKT